MNRKTLKARRRMKRLIIVWCERAAIIVAAGFLIAGVIHLFHSQEGNAEEDTEAQVEKIERTTEKYDVTCEELQHPGPIKFQDLHSMDWSGDDAYLLAKIAMAEAEGESTEGKAMVIMVVLNRVWDEGFEGTIEGVITEHHTNSKGKEVYQFTPVMPGGRWYTVEPNEDCWAALRLIESGWDESEGALYFEATSNGEDTWHQRNLEYIKTVGHHNFYK